MGLPVIGLFVRLVGNGIGLAQEAIAAKKERSRSSAADFAPESSTPKNKGLEMASDAPPPYEENVIQVSPDHAEELIAKGHAVLAETKHDPELSKGHPGEASILKSRSRSVASSTKSGDDDSDDSSSDSEDEAEWALDDAAGDVEDAKSQSDQKKYGFNAQPTIESLVDMVLQKCPSPPSVARRLSLPVILPQRRPGNKDRGFIRAYAPVLTDHGVPEDAFLTFVKNLHTAAKASPILNVVFISAGIVGFFPELAAQITSTVVQIAVGTAIELQKRQRGNSFLDQMNERFFRPRGLFALLMTYKHEGKKPIHSEPVDIMKVISKRTAAEQNLLAPIRLGEGTSYGELEMPESAPLVFPSLDEAAEQTVDAQKMDMLKSSQRFLADYFDRRAQAVYVRIQCPALCMLSQDLTLGTRLPIIPTLASSYRRKKPPSSPLASVILMIPSITAPSSPLLRAVSSIRAPGRLSAVKRDGSGER